MKQTWRKVFETRIAATAEELWSFHASAEALKVLTPPGRKLVPISTDLRVENGLLHVMGFRQFGLPMVWKARISEVDPPFGFVDTAEQSPFAFWQHRHSFIRDGEGSILRDEIEYAPPGGPLAGLINRLMVSNDLDCLFAFRHSVTKQELESKSHS